MQESPLYPAVSSYVALSRDIVFGIHGPVTKTAFSYDVLSWDAGSVVFAGDEIVASFEYTPEQERLLAGALLIRSPQIREFTYAKQ